VSIGTGVIEKTLLIARRFVWVYLAAYFIVTLMGFHYEFLRPNAYQASLGMTIMAGIMYFIMLLVAPVCLIVFAVNNLGSWRGILTLTLFSFLCLSISYFEKLDTTPNHGGEYLEWGIVLFGPVGLTVAALNAYSISRTTLTKNINPSSMDNATNFSRRLNPILITVTLVLVIIYLLTQLT
jgi:hypothetical protein